LNWNDCIDVSAQDSENGTLYEGDAVGVEIFFLVATESDGGICKMPEILSVVGKFIGTLSVNKAISVLQRNSSPPPPMLLPQHVSVTRPSSGGIQ
jgi:hypothetical protein